MKTEITVKIVVEHDNQNGLDFAKSVLQVDKPSDARGGGANHRFRVKKMTINEKKLED